MEEFITKLIEKTQYVLGNDYFLEPVTSIKNNNQKHLGIRIQKHGSSTSPVFYIKGLYEKFKSNILSLDECVSLLLQQVDQPEEFSIDTNCYAVYEDVRPLIRIMLVNYEANKEQLAKKPHFRLLDMAATFYISIHIDKDTFGLLHITNQMLEQWEIDAESFIEEALNTLLRKDFAIFSDVEDTIEKLADKLNEELPESFHYERGQLKGHLYLLSNAQSRYGANMLVNLPALHRFATAHNDNLIIYPSSVHETILVLESDKNTLRLTDKDIAIINANNVSPEERLSNNVYLYDRHLRELRILHQGISLAKLEAICGTIK